LERRSRALAKSFLVLGAAIIIAALIVRTSAAGFRFGSPIFGFWAVLLMIGASAFLSYPRFIEWRRSRWSFWSADDRLVWQDQFADTEEHAPLVLLAATDVFMRSALDFHFARAGFRVEHAASCEEALARTRMQPAAVLLDLSMPNGNAFYCLRDIRYASRDSKIIAFTRKHHPQDATLCRRLGVSDSMPKPFDPTDAVTAVARALHGNTVEETPLQISA
jgi:CheY-like chemotaxis protein